MKKMVRISNISNEFQVFWTLTDFCNQKCSYCPSNLHSGLFANGISPGAPTDDQIINFIDKIKHISIERNKKLKVILSGGEPTLHKMFPTIVDQLYGVGTVMVITNGSRDISWWKNLSNWPNIITLSIHPEYYSKYKHRIHALIKLTFERNVQLQINLLCYPLYWNIIMQIVDDITPDAKSLVIPKIIQDFSNFSRPNIHYTKEQMDFIITYKTKLIDNEHNFSSIITYDDGSTELVDPVKILSTKSNRFLGWKCSAGIDGISVHENGSIQAGICRIKNLGHISNFELLDEYIRCNKSFCACPADIFLSKFFPN